MRNTEKKPIAKTIGKTIAALTTAFGLFIAWIIYLADSRQSSFFFDLVKATPYGDKVGHFFLFGVLTFGLNLVFRNRGCAMGKVFIPYGAVSVFCLVIVEELSQAFFPWRTVDIADILSDFAGIMAFSLISLQPRAQRFFVRPEHFQVPDANA